MIFGGFVGGVISAVCVGEVIEPLAECFHLASSRGLTDTNEPFDP
jgi:hypothetical protein